LVAAEESFQKPIKLLSIRSFSLFTLSLKFLPSIARDKPEANTVVTPPNGFSAHANRILNDPFPSIRLCERHSDYGAGVPAFRSYDE
jgi:hypothetical protein